MAPSEPGTATRVLTPFMGLNIHFLINYSPSSFTEGDLCTDREACGATKALVDFTIVSLRRCYINRSFLIALFSFKSGKISSTTS